MIHLAMAGVVLVASAGPGRAQSSQPAAPPPDHCTGPIDPYQRGRERQRFFRAAGKDNELSAEEFAANAQAGGKDAFARPFDSFQSMRTHDKNRNGTIDWFEAHAYREALRKRVLAAFDADHNGRLRGPERTAANAALQAGKIPAPKSKPAPGQANPIGRVDDRMLAMFDANGDSVLDEEELRVAQNTLAEQRRQKRLARYDADGDGKISPAEQQAIQQDNLPFTAMRESFLLQHFDANGNGQLDGDENEATIAFQQKLGEVGQHVHRRMADRDGDGKISDEEAKALRNEMLVVGIRMQLRMTAWQDTNGDGQLTEAERQAFREKAARGIGKWLDGLTQRFDADASGRLDQAEREQFIKGFQAEIDRRLDAHNLDQDGRISAFEMEAALLELGQDTGTIPQPRAP
jgi:hypothetical protein